MSWKFAGLAEEGSPVRVRQCGTSGGGRGRGGIFATPMWAASSVKSARRGLSALKEICLSASTVM
jgi:hypothetical protein